MVKPERGSLVQPRHHSSLSVTLGNPVLDANGDIVYSASVILDAAAQTVGDNRVVVTYTDTLGSRTTTSIPFSIINQFNVLLTADKTQVKTGGDSLKLSATVVDGASGRVKDQTLASVLLTECPSLKRRRGNL